MEKKTDIRALYIFLFTSFGQYFFVSVMPHGNIDHHMSMSPLIMRDILSQYISRDVLGQYFPPDQWAHGNMVVNASELHKGNEEILSEGGK